MCKTSRFFAGLVVFSASYAILTFLVAPFFTQKGGSEPLAATALERLPIASAVAQGSGAAIPKYFVVQMRRLHEVTASAANYTFLLPPGSNKIVDQAGDPASYSAEEISPGRQRIRLRASFTGPQAGIYTIPASALLAWLVLWLIRRREENAPLAGDDSIDLEVLRYG